MYNSNEFFNYTDNSPNNDSYHADDDFMPPDPPKLIRQNAFYGDQNNMDMNANTELVENENQREELQNEKEDEDENNNYDDPYNRPCSHHNCHKYYRKNHHSDINNQHLHDMNMKRMIIILKEIEKTENKLNGLINQLFTHYQ